MAKKGIKLFIVSLMLSGSLFLSGCSAVDFIGGAVEMETLPAESILEEYLTTAENILPETEESFFAETEESSFAEAISANYAYNCLSESEKLWYRDITEILGGMKEKEKLSDEGIDAGLTETDIDKIFQCVLIDHPEFFYVEGYTYTKYSRQDELTKIEISGTYSMGLEEAKLRSEQIENAVRVILAGIPADAGEYEKVKYVYETLIANTEYDLKAADNQNIYSVFIGKASVCQGYAKATQYLLSRLGVECTIVMGNVNSGEGHAWNLVKVDGNYYYMDTTWGDASYQMEDGTDSLEVGTPPEINYDYLCVTTEQLLRTHTLGGIIPVPECTAMDANYYVREGVYFTAYNEEQLRVIFTKAAELGRTDVTLKCADSATYQNMNDILITQQGIFDYLNSPDGAIAYSLNEQQLSMTFWMTNDGQNTF